jgi:hypothetical protein
MSGNPILKNGNPIVKSRSAFNLKQPEVQMQEQGSVDTLDQLEKTVKDNPEAVGSLGSDPLNYVLNNINDMLKIPTDTRLARNQIASTSGVLAANIRSMYESGVMTESDFTRYMKMVPNEDDSVPEFLYKTQMLRNDMIKNYGRKAEAQGTKAPVSTVKLEDLMPLGNGLYKMPDGTVIRKKAK